MSTNEDDFDENDGTDSADANAPKALRAQVKKLNLKLAELETENGTLKKDQRTRTVAEELAKHGASQKLVKYVDNDDVLVWLKENGEDFGWSETTDEDEDEEVVEQARLIRRSSDNARQAPATRSVTREMLASTSYEELKKQGLVL